MSDLQYAYNMYQYLAKNLPEMISEYSCFKILELDITYWFREALTTRIAVVIKQRVSFVFVW